MDGWLVTWLVTFQPNEELRPPEPLIKGAALLLIFKFSFVLYFVRVHLTAWDTWEFS